MTVDELQGDEFTVVHSPVPVAAPAEDTRVVRVVLAVGGIPRVGRFRVQRAATGRHLAKACAARWRVGVAIAVRNMATGQVMAVAPGGRLEEVGGDAVLIAVRKKKAARERAAKGEEGMVVKAAGGAESVEVRFRVAERGMALRFDPAATVWDAKVRIAQELGIGADEAVTVLWGGKPLRESCLLKGIAGGQREVAAVVKNVADLLKTVVHSAKV
jgi:hypothetical protein